MAEGTAWGGAHFNEVLEFRFYKTRAIFRFVMHFEALQEGFCSRDAFS